MIHEAHVGTTRDVSIKESMGHILSVTNINPFIWIFLFDVVHDQYDQC